MDKEQAMTLLRAFQSRPLQIDNHPRYEVLSKLSAGELREGIGVRGYGVRLGSPPTLMDSSERLMFCCTVLSSDTQVLFNEQGQVVHPNDTAQRVVRRTLTGAGNGKHGSGILVLTQRRLILNLLDTALLGIAPNLERSQVLVEVPASDLMSATIMFNRNKPTKKIMFTGQRGAARSAIIIEAHQTFSLADGRKGRIRASDFLSLMGPALQSLWQGSSQTPTQWSWEDGDQVYPLPGSADSRNG